MTPYEEPYKKRFLAAYTVEGFAHLLSKVGLVVKRFFAHLPLKIGLVVEGFKIFRKSFWRNPVKRLCQSDL